MLTVGERLWLLAFNILSKWRGLSISRENRDPQVNEQIRLREVRLVDENGTQLGIMSSREALQIARERNLDLVIIAPNAKPPVCKIMDYGRYKYQRSKHEREARKKQKVITIKEVQLSQTIEERDLLIKARNADRMLKNGNKIRVVMRFRGRQIVHADLGNKVFDRFVEAVENGVVEKEAQIEGRNMIMIMAPKPEKGAN
ncbi:MAG: translation initiation factor IF-3 [Firmicutes bacterium]|nr:translation initiation factor IF-3 [Bacillota bacterium]